MPRIPGVGRAGVRLTGARLWFLRRALRHMIGGVVVAAFHVCAAVTHGQSSAPTFGHVAPDALRDSGHAALLRFEHYWAAQWRGRYEGARREWSPDSLRLRTTHLACLLTEPNAHLWRVHQGSAIRSGFGAFAVCPTWVIGRRREKDERLDVDASLDAASRERVRGARAEAISNLGNLRALLPGDDWLVGQHIRLLVDQQDWPNATREAATCTASAWWCAALRGYVAASRVDRPAAEAAFAGAVSLQTAEARCEWSDASRLLDSAARASYSAIPCAARANIDAWLWWLADPLWAEHGNERWLEQQVRRMLVAFRQQIGRDERFDWRREAGGDALADLVLRYGWPTYLHWNGAEEDAVRSVYLNAHGSPTNAPYTTFEYSPGRIHAIPSWRAITQPLAATVTDWELRPPSGAMEHAGAELVWWPVEHFEAVRPLVQLGPIEVAFLRREREVILAVAGDLDTATIGRVRGDSVHGHLVLSEAPGDVRRIGELRGVSSRMIVGRGTMQPGNSLLSVEIPSHGNAPAARSRFAISAPATLGIAPNAYGISDPIVLRVPENGDSLPNEMEEALEHMAPPARFADSQIGVYFETYGLTPTDTAELAVWIERDTPQGVLRVLGNALGITTDLNTPMAISWIGTAVNAAHQVDGSTHILGRTVVLDLSELVPGEYWLDVAVAKPGGPTVRGRQRITVQ